MKERIIAAADAPRALEALYREDPAGFTRAFPDAHAERAGSTVLHVWHERLFFDGPSGTPAAGPPGATGRRLGAAEIVGALLVTLAGGTLLRLPGLVPGIDAGEFQLRNFAAIIAGALVVWFCVRRRCRIGSAAALLGALLGGVFYLNALHGPPHSQSVPLACLHMAFLFWCLVGGAFLRGAWRDRAGWLDYARYNGELLVHATILAIGAVVLMALTFALFELIDLHIEAWYRDNALVYVAVAVPVVGTLLVESVIGERLRIAPMLARLFTPPFLVTVCVYLVAMCARHRSPFTDREFLIAFNALLAIVLGLSVFALIGRRDSGRPAGALDLMNIALVLLTLAIDGVALAAILFRLSTYGFTPNRVAVLGANLLIACHLAGIAWHYARFASKRGAPLEGVQGWITGFIPIYAAWSLAVALGFPPLFQCR